ncbi:serine dehydratase subunit alpha family protein [Iocasia frigidifontis]|uniref:UPF0597 protein GM661_05260 n=1 Tax=Iocasia fonsfrigidae TaxID=2682810 RepID=A0A8A7K7L8_9FIRM|nr:L-serine ammonia-lyase, iron-sulfur-dependent, subunit alpha [Iocasia fonsfrigidae]QTL97431.1 serine dehydratase subunit alpha family protein [Iocasia fonsfrigidae]
MSLKEREIGDYINILKEELIPALGCTEPIAIAYAAAKAREVLNQEPIEVEVKCSGNIFKNVKGVIVPNSGNLKGIKAAAVIGVIGGKAEKKLEVLSNVAEEDIKETKRLLKTNYCSVKLLKSKADLHIIVSVRSKTDTALVELIETHTNIIKIKNNGKIIFNKPFIKKNNNNSIECSPLTVKKIIQFADTVSIKEVEKIIERQIDLNSKISKAGLTNKYGMNIGLNLIKYRGDNIKTRAKAFAAAGSDARMNGCLLPAVINSGSGNQGITTSLPVIEYAKYLKVEKEVLIRALIISNLIAIHIKEKIGRLSAFCGAVSAACGSGAAITYLYNGTYEQISSTIINTLGNVSGIICDGAKPSCAAKIASAVDAAIMAHDLTMSNQTIQVGDGIIQNDIEKTIDVIGHIGGNGMKKTDETILEAML